MIYITRLKPYRSVTIGNKRDGQKYSIATADTQAELDQLARALGFLVGNRKYTLNPRQFDKAKELGATVY